MSKKQSDYLSSLLATPNIPEPALVSPEPAKRAMTLLARESSLARVASGEIKQVTQLLIDPERVRIWPGNARHQGSLNEESCRDLIDAILAEGGQKVPAIVRRVNGHPDYDYEVIAGSRRHWTISWLRANNYPDMHFLAQVHTLDDEAAFRLSDIENRARKDVSDFERARTYLQALGDHYGGKQVRMAERLHLSKGWLSKMLTVAALPDWLVDTFSSPAEIQLKTCYPLAQKIQHLALAHDEAALKKVKAVAADIAAHQAQMVAQGRAPLTAADIIKRLMHADHAQSADMDSVSFDAPTGRTALSVLSANRNGVSIRLHAGSGATEADLLKMLKGALIELEQQGRGLKL